MFTSKLDTGCNSRFKKRQRNELTQKLKGADMIQKKKPKLPRFLNF